MSIRPVHPRSRIGGFDPTQHFEACSFGRSDTPPPTRLPDPTRPTSHASTGRQGRGDPTAPARAKEVVQQISRIPAARTPDTTSSTLMCISGDPRSWSDPAAQGEDLRADAPGAEGGHDVELLEVETGPSNQMAGRRLTRANPTAGRRSRRGQPRSRAARGSGRTGRPARRRRRYRVSNSVLKSHSNRPRTPASSGVARRTVLTGGPPSDGGRRSRRGAWWTRRPAPRRRPRDGG